MPPAAIPNPTTPPADSPPWIDSHCHLADEEFAGDLDAVLGRARAAGVGRMVVVADSLAASERALELAAGRPCVRATAGVHAHHAGDWNEETRAALRSLCEKQTGGDALAAIGETGLDFHYGFAEKDAQTACFLEHCELARELGLPLVIHVREAFDTFFELARKHDLGDIGGVVHCFSGGGDDARRAAEMGFHIGIGGILTFKKNQDLLAAARATPLDRLVLETDAPYLAPAPHRGKRNEPAFLPHTAERLADALDMDLEELAQIVFRNTLRLFRMDAWPLDSE